MGMIQLRERWRRQPDRLAGIDWSHPLSRGLVSHFVGNMDADWTAINGPTRESSIAGLARRFASASSQYMSRPARVTGLPLTIGAIARRASASSTQGIAGIGAATDSRFELYFTPSAAAFQSRNASGTGAVSSSIVTSTSQFYALVGVANSTTSRSIFVNGGNKATDTGASAPDPCNTEVIGAFYSSGAASLHLDGAIALVCIWARALSDQEVADWSANPWQVFAPKAAPIFFAAGSGTTLTLADASHTHAADAIALTQQHQLATADASHGHTADAITLVQQHAIAIADAMHAHNLDALTLAVQSTLAMSDAAHAHAADNVTLAAAGTLVVADASHGHTVDAVTLTQQHLLALTDALHGHGSDVVTLNTGLLLAIADAVHAQSVDALVLSQAHVLVLADAAHAHLADALALVMPGAITTLPDRTLVIAAESRALVIVTETRALAIGAEARVLTIH